MDLILKSGAVAMLDALGYKKKAKKDPIGVVKRMLFIQKDALAQLDGVFKTYAAGKAKIESFVVLDTIFVRCIDPEPARAVVTIATYAGFLQIAGVDDAAGKGVPYLTFRGSVTFGESLFASNLVSGPAVIEAADNHELKPVGAFVYLTETAARAGIADETVRDITVRWKMPLKGGHTLDKRVINPLIHTTDPPSAVGDILRTFDSSEPNTVEKRCNTEAFLGTCLPLAEAFKRRVAEEDGGGTPRGRRGPSKN